MHNKVKRAHAKPVRRPNLLSVLVPHPSHGLQIVKKLGVQLGDTSTASPRTFQTRR